jgi:hypothetical protein
MHLWVLVHLWHRYSNALPIIHHGESSSKGGAQSVYDPSKVFISQFKFSSLAFLFLDPTHKTKIGIQNRWQITDRQTTCTNHSHFSIRHWGPVRFYFISHFIASYLFLLVWLVSLAQVWTHYKIEKLNMWTLFCNVCIDFLSTQLWKEIMFELNGKCRSVSTFSTDFSFQDLVFWNFIWIFRGRNHF